ECRSDVRFTVRGRKVLANEVGGKSIKEVLKGKSEVNLGTVYFNTAFKQKDNKSCLAGRTSLSGKLQLSPKAQNWLKENGGGVLVVTPHRDILSTYVVQSLSPGQPEISIEIKGIPPKSGYQALFVYPCPAGSE